MAQIAYNEQLLGEHELALSHGSMTTQGNPLGISTSTWPTRSTGISIPRSAPRECGCISFKTRWFPCLLAKHFGVHRMADHNRLYVAVSRPKRRLFVVDSTAGLQRLWEFATNQKMEESLLLEMRDKQVWEGKVGGMVDGSPEHLDTDDAPDLEEEAKNIESQGLSRSDAYLLRSAANRYRIAGHPAKVAFCTAEAHFADECYAEAGRDFLKCGHPARAVDSFWREGRSADKLLMEAAASKPELQNRLEAEFSRFLVAPRDHYEGFGILTKLADRTADEEEAMALTSCNYWTEPTRQVGERVVELGEKQKESPDWRNISALLVSGGLKMG